jgi:hypothetical protein
MRVLIFTAFVSAAAAGAQNKPSALQKSRAVIGFGGQGKESAAAARDIKGDDGSLKIGEVDHSRWVCEGAVADESSCIKPPCRKSSTRSSPRRIISTLSCI